LHRHHIHHRGRSLRRRRGSRCRRHESRRRRRRRARRAEAPPPLSAYCPRRARLTPRGRVSSARDSPSTVLYCTYYCVACGCAPYSVLSREPDCMKGTPCTYRSRSRSAVSLLCALCALRVLCALCALRALSVLCAPTDPYRTYGIYYGRYTVSTQLTRRQNQDFHYVNDLVKNDSTK
jgi:hypothetical protein